MKIATIEALDHFSSDSGTKEYRVLFTGELIDENVDYYFLRSMGYIKGSDRSKVFDSEVKGVLKSTVKKIYIHEVNGVMESNTDMETEE